MADIELVIKIPDQVYQHIMKDFPDMFWSPSVKKAILNGTPLPKGHGDLIDASDLTPDADYEDGIFGAVSCQQIVEAEVIIEADKEWSDGDSN